MQTISKKARRFHKLPAFNLLARRLKLTPNTKLVSYTHLIVIHCSATRVTQDFTFEQLEACHLARGFKSIGYHYYITKDGVVYPGRPESEVGAHARHYNAHSIGICYEGGLDKNGKPADTRTPAQNQALYSLLESLCLSYPDAEIPVSYTHLDVYKRQT